ncbi:MAG: hypothetical protein FJZ97_11030 [Chloroflexi bacterium]|nr:hypothetical protein [Chloroflexota bacterium]
MSIWYSISAEFTLRPDVDRHVLAAAVAAYEEATVPAVRIADDTVTVEAEGDMCRGTADDLRAGLVRLIRDFGDGAAVHITTRSSDDDDEGPWHGYAGRKAAVLTALAQDLTWRLDELRAQYARELEFLADVASDAFVATTGW